MSVAGLVLAAGASTRFRGPTNKLLAPFRGRPLWIWAVEAAAGAGFEELIVVTGAVDLGEELAALGARSVREPRWAGGQAVSLAAGLAAAAGHDAAVVGLADQPLMGSEAWRAVGSCTESQVAVATFGGLRRPPVRLAAEIWPLLPASGDEGARALMRQRPELVTEVPCSGEPIDIDTVEDLHQWS